MTASQVPESAEVRWQRVWGWLDRDGVLAMLTAGAKDAYQESGRGFWLASFQRAGRRRSLSVEWQWFTATAWRESVRSTREARPGLGSAADTPGWMLDTYDPRREFVLVVEDVDGAINSCKLRYEPTSSRPEGPDDLR